MKKTQEELDLLWKRLRLEAPIDLQRYLFFVGLPNVILIRPDMPDLIAGRWLIPPGEERPWNRPGTIEINGHHRADRRRLSTAFIAGNQIFADESRIGRCVTYDISCEPENEDAFRETDEVFVGIRLMPIELVKSLGLGTTAEPAEVAEALGVSELVIQRFGHGALPEDYLDLSPEAVMAEIEPRGAAKIERLMGEAPVDIEGIAVEHGLFIRVRGDLADEVSGSLLREEAGWTIEVNGMHHIHRRRHTMALELAHFLLHRDAAGGGVTHRRDGTGGLDAARKTAANAMAADLLMPRPLIAKLRARPKPPLIGIARTLGVSDRALAVREEGRRDPTPGDYENPKAA